jgi:hypothetical protein
MICVNHNRPRHPFRYLLVIPAVAMLALSACGAETSDESLPADDVSSNSSPANDSDANTPETESSPETGESQDTDDGAEVGANNSPDGDGLTGDKLAENISKEYQARWSEFLGMPMENADAPVRCDGLEAAVGATTECEVKMAEGLWMPLDVEVTTVTPIGIEYSVTPNLYG